MHDSMRPPWMVGRAAGAHRYAAGVDDTGDGGIEYHPPHFLLDELKKSQDESFLATCWSACAGRTRSHIFIRHPRKTLC